MSSFMPPPLPPPRSGPRLVTSADIVRRAAEREQARERRRARIDPLVALVWTGIAAMVGVEVWVVIRIVNILVRALR